MVEDGKVDTHLASFKNIPAKAAGLKKRIFSSAK